MFTDSGKVRSYAESDLTTNDPMTGGTRGYLSLSLCKKLCAAFGTPAFRADIGGDAVHPDSSRTKGINVTQLHIVNLIRKMNAPDMNRCIHI